jgi:hypothetical protein
LREPSWAGEPTEIDTPPVREEGVTDFPFEVRVLPFRCPHDVVVFVTDDIGDDAVPPLDLRVVVRVVGNVADVEYTQRSPENGLDLV